MIEKKYFEMASLEVVSFAVNDVVTTSPGGEDNWGTGEY